MASKIREHDVPGDGLVGTRVRTRRLGQGIRQADLARMVGISPAYLNLIEHNKRRIGGKLLIDLARALEIEPGLLAEGPEAAQFGLIRAAAEREPEARAETDRTDELVGRFPGWAALMARQHQRIRSLERLVETLSDRLTHDPHLAANLHEMLTTVTAIRSAVSILTEEGEVDPDWQARFLRNVGEDTDRLSASAGELVAFLEGGGDVAEGHVSVQEELGLFLEANGFAFAALEPGATEIADAALPGWELLQSRAARHLARDWLARYRADAHAMPAEDFAHVWEEAGQDPFLAASRLGLGADAVMRRAAFRPGAGEVGLVICDAAGAFTTRKPLPGFAVPRYGAACPLWPLYQALSQPGRAVAAELVLPGPVSARFHGHAMATLRTPEGLRAPELVEATMLILPGAAPATAQLPTREIGSTCRICPRGACDARREPSILSATA